MENRQVTQQRRIFSGTLEFRNVPEELKLIMRHKHHSQDFRYF